MTRRFSLLIANGCLALLVVVPLAALYLLADIEAFAALASRNLPLPIRWHTVTDAQWYGLWCLTALYVGLGLAGIVFLRRAFARFADGELFTVNNSRHLRLFSIFVFAQALAKPVHFALSSVLLSWHHPPGQKVLSIMLGSGECQLIALAMILWVMSDLLVKARTLEHENRQFV